MQGELEDAVSQQRTDPVKKAETQAFYRTIFSN
jgi:hypothetical protein